MMTTLSCFLLSHDVLNYNNTELKSISNSRKPTYIPCVIKNYIPCVIKNSPATGDFAAASTFSIVSAFT